MGNNLSVDWGPPGIDLTEVDPADLDTAVPAETFQFRKSQILLGPSGSRRL